MKTRRQRAQSQLESPEIPSASPQSPNTTDDRPKKGRRRQKVEPTESEEQVDQPSKKAKRHISAALEEIGPSVAELEGSLGSASEDDEAPEEVSLACGKQAAQQRQQLEKDAKKSASEQKKRRRQKLEPAAEAAQAENRSGNASEGDAAVPQQEERALPTTQDSEQPASKVERLSDAVIKALQERSREKEVENLGSVDARLPVKQRKRLTERQAGPVTVRVLQADQKFSPSAAIAYSQQQRLGGDWTRSRDMLRQTKTRKQREYRPSAEFGKAARRVNA